MMEDFFQLFETMVQFLGTQLFAVLAYPVSSSERIFWLYLLSAVVFAGIVFIRSAPSPRAPFSPRAFIRFLFPPEVWRTPSAWLDVRYFFFHQIFRVLIYGAFLAAALNLTYAAVAGVSDLPAASTRPMGGGVTEIAISTVYMIALIALVDLIAYALHYAQHKVPILWEFHKVHHSLEVMHPLSNYREHPIDNIVYAAGTGAGYGLLMGLTKTHLGYLPGMPQLLGVPLLAFAFNILGYNLRHSHIWLRWPGRWSMAFASPAHHHVHHSCHPDHVDRNFAFMFPIWDVLFGTYCVPESGRDVRFGLSDTPVHGYTSCLGLYLNPFRNLLARRQNDGALRVASKGD